LIGANSASEIVFTSGATESNNLCLKGAAWFYGESEKPAKERKKNHLITVVTEHKCVLDSCRSLEQEGYEVTYLPVQTNGLIDLKQLEAAIRPSTIIVSVMAVNNEIGVIQPLKQIGQICKSKGVLFHSDAAQAAGKIPLNVNEMNINMLSISGHKIYGPKGIGAVYVSKKPRVRLDPIISGGGQERGLRSGTLPSPLIVGMGEACRVAKQELRNDFEHVTALSKRLYDGVTSRLTHVVVNGDPVQRYPGNLNLSFSCVEGESLLMSLKEVAVSSGSACTSATLEPSYVLRALGVSEDMAHTSLRFGIGRFTTEEEIDYAVDKIVLYVNRLRDMSPLWEMVQEGIDLNTIKWTSSH